MFFTYSDTLRNGCRGWFWSVRTGKSLWNEEQETVGEEEEGKVNYGLFHFNSCVQVI